MDPDRCIVFFVPVRDDVFVLYKFVYLGKANVLQIYTKRQNIGLVQIEVSADDICGVAPLIRCL